MKKRINYSYNRKTEGFSLIEIIFIVVIISLVFITIYSFMTSTIKYDTESRHEFIASNLAQEGVEIIKNIRAENLLKEVEDTDNEVDEGIPSVCYPEVNSSATNTECLSDPTVSANLFLDGFSYTHKKMSNEFSTIYYRECRTSKIPARGGNNRFETICEVCWESFVGSEGYDPSGSSKCNISSVPSDRRFRSTKIKTYSSTDDWN